MVPMNQKAPRQRTGRGRHTVPALIGLCGWAALLAACGGGGGDGGGDSDPGGGDGGDGSGWSPGVFMPSSSFAAQCADPRSGIDPETGQPFSDVQGTVLDENNFLRSYSDETYLWYDEIADQDPGNFNDPLAYFDELKTTDVTASGAAKDRFHFTYPTEEWRQLSQGGISVGYGFEWVMLPAPDDDTRGDIVIAYTEADSPATAPGADLTRGTRIVAVDGVDVATGPAGPLNAGLFPAGEGESHEFTVEEPGADGNTRAVTLVAEQGAAAPVHNVRTVASPMGTVGYLTFNDHSATAETALLEAIEHLALEDVEELVLDIRYNGGGYLAIASQLAYMIAGPARTGGRTFERMQFNDKHPSTNPVTGNPLSPMPFFGETLGDPFPEPAGQSLPALDLQRVFVLTGPDTCSASEAIMNGLSGIDFEVIQIGSPTCGKPYGFYATDNCGTSYFTIQFRGVNDQGDGDYVDGFFPASGPSDVLPGCRVADDFTQALGDPLEERLNAALGYIDTGACPAAPAAAHGEAKTAPGLSAVDGRMPKPPWRENRILRRSQ